MRWHAWVVCASVAFGLVLGCSSEKEPKRDAPAAPAAKKDAGDPQGPPPLPSQ